MTLDWKAAFSFFVRDPSWKRKIFLGGLWILLLPPLGWPIALGHRKEMIFALVEGRAPVLPVWSGQLTRFATEGAKAIGVILVYFLPFLVTFWLLSIDEWELLRMHGLEFAVFAAAIVLLLPIFLPLLPPLYWYLFDWVDLSPIETVLVGAMFWGTTFLMPAVFLQVSLFGRFSAAFRVRAVLSFVRRNTRHYVEAWIISVLATGTAAALGPAAPWGIFWSYLVIVYTFNEALYRSGTLEVERRFKRSCFALEADAAAARNAARFERG